MLAADVSNWLRPGAATSPERLFCHVYGRGQGAGADDPGLAVLGHRGAGAGPHLLDRGAGRGAAGPDDDETEVTAVQVREVITRLIAAGHWREGDLPVLVVFDAGLRRDPAGLAAGGPAGGAARAGCAATG